MFCSSISKKGTDPACRLRFLRVYDDFCCFHQTDESGGKMDNDDAHLCLSTIFFLKFSTMCLFFV